MTLALVALLLSCVATLLVVGTIDRREREEWHAQDHFGAPIGEDKP